MVHPAVRQRPVTFSQTPVKQPGAKWQRIQASREGKLKTRFTSTFRKQCLYRQNVCRAGIPVPDVVVGGNLLHTFCHVASSVIIVLACARNAPQIVRCWRRKSATGISMASLATEISCYASLVAYGTRRGYAPTIWGAELACWLQDASLLLLVSYLRNVRLPIVAGVGVSWLCAQALLFTEMVPMWFLSKFQIFVGLVLGLGARVPQIVLNMRNGHTGNLAAPTFIFNATANTVCFISATVLTGDIYVIATQVWMFILNCTILSQIFKSERKLKQEASTRESPVTVDSPLLASRGMEESSEVTTEKSLGVARPDEILARWVPPLDQDTAHGRGGFPQKSEPHYALDT